MAVTHCTIVDDGILFTILDGVLPGQKIADPVLLRIDLNIS